VSSAVGVPAGWHQPNRIPQLIRIRYRFAVHADYEILDQDARVLCGGILVDGRDQSAGRVGQFKRFRVVVADSRDSHAEQAAANFAEFDQLLHDTAGHFDRNCEPDPDVATGAGNNGGVDAHQLAFQID
jgi:hypothetical protein